MNKTTNASTFLLVGLYISLVITSVLCVLNGIILATSASITLFLVLLFVPMPIITLGGALHLFLGINIFEKIVGMI